MTDDPGPRLIDISDAHHLTSFYVILFYYTTFAQIPVEVVQMISRKPVSAFCDISKLSVLSSPGGAGQGQISYD